jgi:hypothetical protein
MGRPHLLGTSTDRRRRCGAGDGAHLCGQLLEAAALVEAHDIPVQAFKGPVLSVLAYGAVGQRGFNDLDLLVRRVDLPTVRRLLERRGYRLPPRYRRALSGHVSAPGPDREDGARRGPDGATEKRVHGEHAGEAELCRDEHAAERQWRKQAVRVDDVECRSLEERAHGPELRKVRQGHAERLDAGVGQAVDPSAFEPACADGAPGAHTVLRFGPSNRITPIAPIPGPSGLRGYGVPPGRLQARPMEAAATIAPAIASSR